MIGIKNWKVNEGLKTIIFTTCGLTSLKNMCDKGTLFTLTVQFLVVWKFPQFDNRSSHPSHVSGGSSYSHGQKKELRPTITRSVRKNYLFYVGSFFYGVNKVIWHGSKFSFWNILTSMNFVNPLSQISLRGSWRVLSRFLHHFIPVKPFSLILS